jgi:hypothetical protein
MCKDSWLLNSDRVIFLSNMKDQDGNIASDAIVRLVSFREVISGQNVSGIIFPANFENLGSGKYEYIVEDTVNLIENKYYEAEIKITIGNFIQTFFIRKPARKDIRSCC